MSNNNKFKKIKCLDSKHPVLKNKRFNDEIWLDAEIKQLDKDFHYHEYGYYEKYRDFLLKKLWSLE